MSTTLTETQPHVEGVSHHFVESGGLKFHVAEAGQGEPLVLLHGWPQHWYMWRLLMPELAKHYRVIAPDLRGFGWTDATRDGYEKENLATDMLGLLSEMGIERFRLLGHDWGGWIGYLMCLRAPQRVSHFMPLAIPAPWGTDSTVKGMRNVWRFWYQVVLSTPFVGSGVLMSDKGYVARIVLGGSKVREHHDRESLSSYADRLKEPARVRASQLMYRTFMAKELPKTFTGGYGKSRLKVPTLSLLGAHDPVITPSLLDGYEHHADDMEVRVIEQSGHFMAEEVPEIILEAALPFFAAEN